MSKKFAAIICTAVLACLSLEGQEAAAPPAQPRTYTSKQIGDEAFRDGYYSLAVKYYAKYKNEAAAAEDSDARIDAHFKLISSNCLAGNSILARNELRELNEAFAERIQADISLKRNIAFWNGSVLLLEKRLDKAVEVFSTLQKNLPKDDPLYVPCSNALGFSLVRQQKWDAAETVFAALEADTGGTKTAESARRNRMLCALMSGNPEKVKAVFPDGAEGAQTAPKDTPLRIIMLLKAGRADDAVSAYRSARKQVQGPDCLWYFAVMETAKALVEKKSPQKAIPLLEDAKILADESYDREEASLLLINTCLAAGDKEGVSKTCQEFIRIFPDSPSANDVRLQLARLFSSEGKIKESIGVYNEILGSPSSAQAQKLSAAKEAGEMLMAEKRFQDAREKYIFILNSTQDPGLSGEASFKLAETFMIEGKFDEAAAKFSEVAEKAPGWREKAIMKRLGCLYGLKDYRRAIADLKAYFDEFKQGSLMKEALILEADCLYNLNESESAQDRYLKFADKFPDAPETPEALYKAANLAFLKGGYDLSEQTFSRIISKHPSTAFAAPALYKKLYIHLLAGKAAEAEADAAALKEKYPSSAYAVHAMFALADFQRDSGSPQKAVETLAKISGDPASPPAFAAEALYDAAYTLFKMGKNNEAVALLDKLSKEYPNEAKTSEGFYLAGDIYSSANDWEKALIYYTKAADKRPESDLETAAFGRIGDCHFALAWKGQDNIRRAAEFYGRIVDRKNVPANFREQALYSLGRCDELLGDKEKALSRYHEVIYGYKIDAETGTRRSALWLVKSAFAAVKIYLDKDTPEAAQAAAGVYGRLIEMNIEPVDDFRKCMNDIYDRYKLKE